MQVCGGLGENIKTTPLGRRREVVKVVPDIGDVLVAQGTAVDLPNDSELSYVLGREGKRLTASW